MFLFMRPIAKQPDVFAAQLRVWVAICLLSISGTGLGFGIATFLIWLRTIPRNCAESRKITLKFANDLQFTRNYFFAFEDQ